MKITIKTPDQFKDGHFRLASGGNFKRISPLSISHWIEKAIKKQLLAVQKEKKSSQIAVRVIYANGDHNESLDSLDCAYLYNTTLIFLEDFISKDVINKTKKYSWSNGN